MHLITSRTRALLVLAVAIAGVTGLAGCGGSPSDAAAIRATLRAAAHGLLAGDGAAVCATLTQGEIEHVAAAGVEAGVGASCPRTMHILAGDLAVNERAKLRDITIAHLTIHGDHASGVDSTGGAPDRFTKIDGHWYISGGLG